jgi:anti-sigma B factor antagonist
MVYKVKMNVDVFRFSIEGKMTACMVDELGEAILPAIVYSQEIEIDLSQVSEIDLAGLRLMVDAKMEAISRDKKLRFTGHSRPVAEILGQCDLSGFFGAAG